MRARGIPEKMMHQLLSGKKPTREEHLRGKELQAKRMADPEWMKQLIAGDQLTQIEFMAFCSAVGCYESPA